MASCASRAKRYKGIKKSGFMRIDGCFKANHCFSQYFAGATNIQAHESVSAGAESGSWIECESGFEDE